MNTQTKAHHCGCRPPAIVIRGLPGIGKTTLANAIVEHLRSDGLLAFHINADDVRSTLNKDLGFTPKERIENARRLGSIAFLASSNGMTPVVDFVMPTKATFDVFTEALGDPNMNLWSLRSSNEFRSRFADTAKMFERMQEWWGGGVFDYLYELPPFQEDAVQTTADRIVNSYHRNLKSATT